MKEQRDRCEDHGLGMTEKKVGYDSGQRREGIVKAGCYLIFDYWENRYSRIKYHWGQVYCGQRREKVKQDLIFTRRWREERSSS